jgi:hypothetical protein
MRRTVIAIALLLTGCGESADDALVRTYQELAVVRVKMTMRDVNAMTENVLFHPMPGDGPDGRSYVCGYVKPSRDLYAPPQRFIYYFHLDTVAFISQLGDRELAASTNRLCA